MTKLRSLCEETGIGILLVSHLKKPSGDKGWEDGLQISLNSLRGSAGIAQLSDICIGVERNQQGDNPDVSTIRVLKNIYRRNRHRHLRSLQQRNWKNDRSPRPYGL